MRRGVLPGSGALVGVFAVVGVGLLVGAALFAGGSPAPTSSPSTSPSSGLAAAGGSPGPSVAGSPPTGTPTPSAGPTQTPATNEVPLVVVADVRDLRDGISSATLEKELAAGRVVVPCEVHALALGGAPLAFNAGVCQASAKITAAVRARTPRLGLLPAALVTPRVKALRLDGADVLGSPAIRAKPYPLTGSADALPEAWTAFDGGEVRTIVSLGDTCPDRGVSRKAVIEKKGWGWVLGGGTARYTGTHLDRRFTGPDGRGWPVVDAVRTGNAGAVSALVSDAEITLDAFECPATKAFSQHDTGTVFSIDPKVVPLLKGAGVDVVALASAHATDQGAAGLRETLRLLDASKVKRFGAGATLAEALRPAIVDAGGVRFAFVGFNEIPGSTRAEKSTPGVAWLTEANVRSAIAAARKVADVVIVVPQWGQPPYHAGFTARQKALTTLFFDAGADQVLGHGARWAGAVAISKGARGYRFVLSSHGNFLYDQDWSRQTEEGVVAELTFVGSTLAQARLHPYVVLDNAQPNLIAPTTDGAFVLNQVWKASTQR